MEAKWYTQEYAVGMEMQNKTLLPRNGESFYSTDVITKVNEVWEKVIFRVGEKEITYQQFVRITEARANGKYSTSSPVS